MGKLRQRVGKKHAQGHAARSPRRVPAVIRVGGMGVSSKAGDDWSKGAEARLAGRAT